MSDATPHPQEGKTPTPRTDAVASDGWSGDAICVDADFARQLETELAASKARIEALERIVEAVCTAEESRRATVDERLWLTDLANDARSLLNATPTPPQD